MEYWRKGLLMIGVVSDIDYSREAHFCGCAKELFHWFKNPSSYLDKGNFNSALIKWRISAFTLKVLSLACSSNQSFIYSIYIFRKEKGRIL
jgi:hypothetical protein